MRTDQHSTPSTAVTTTRAVVQLRYGSPEVLAVADVPIPAPGPEEVLVRVEAASVNAQDWHIMRGEPRIARLMAPAVFRLRRPRVPVRGTDFAGVVVAVGEKVEGWRSGDRVFGQGVATFAEHAVARADEIAAIPGRLTVDQAAALPLAGSTALQCLEEARALPGSRLLINGASGGVGTYAIQIARTMGLHVTAVVSPRNVGQARRLGAEEVVDYTTDDFTSSGQRYDVVLDLVGNRRLAELRRVVAPEGALVLSGGGVPGTGRILGPFTLLVQSQLQARRSEVALHVPKGAPTTERLEHLARLVVDGEVEVVLDRTFPLERAGEAIGYLETVHPQGKVVIRVR
jgi:NADPH:quinone reductase-like Zn-dependent oxidoreductase